MGLDMYLRAERYVSASKVFEDDDPAHFERLLETFGDSELRAASNQVHFKSARVSFTVAYWRKANQIHSWFVRECQEGRDECQLTYVQREKLEELRNICLRVWAEKDEDLAEELLNPEGGFFFGTADINNWYWEAVKDTIGQLDKVIALPDTWTIYYQSSW